VTPVEQAAEIIAAARRRRDSLTIAEAAREAYHPGGPTFDELVERIAARRARRAA
jgi:hypothetical protein